MSHLGEDHVLEDVKDDTSAQESEVDTVDEDAVSEEAGDGLPFPVYKEEEHVLVDDRQQLDAQGKLITSSESVVQMEQSTDHGELPDRMPVEKKAQLLVDDSTVEVTEVEDEGNTT